MSFIETTTENSDFTMNGSYTIYLIDCTNNNVTVTLADIDIYIGNGYTFTMRRVDTSSNTLTIVGTNGQTIDGGSSFSLPISGKMDKTFLSWNSYWTSLF